MDQDHVEAINCTLVTLAAEEGSNLLLDRIDEGERLGTRTGAGGGGRLAVRHKGRASDLRGPRAREGRVGKTEHHCTSCVTSAQSYEALLKKKC
jgi:hypothetical protein